MMAQITEKLKIIAEELNFLLREKFVSTNDLIITPEGSLNAFDVNVGYVYYNQSGIARLYYEKTGLQELMVKFQKQNTVS
jgi:hypothetical protein